MYKRSLEVIAEEGALRRRAHPGDSLVVDGVTAHCLAPDSPWMSGSGDANEASVVEILMSRRIP